jgi:hypothetical protein
MRWSYSADWSPRRGWAEHAAAFQHRDAAAVCADPGSAPRRHFIVRPRGASKTTDAAGVGLALLVEEAPRRSRSYIYAVDADQAGEVLDALGGFVATTRGWPARSRSGRARPR